MAMATDRSPKALHNFTIPCELRWVNKKQKHIRCVKVNSSPRRRHRRKPVGEGGSSSLEFVHGSQNSGGGRRFGDVDGDVHDGIAAVREKLMVDLQTAANRMRDAIFKGGAEEIEIRGSPPASGSVSSAADDSKGLTADAPGLDSGPRAETSMRLRSGGGCGFAASNGQKKERPNFAVGLSKREVEEDFYGMVGRRLPRRPKKRARVVQRRIDTLLPGLWLKEVTSDMYKVYEATP